MKESRQEIESHSSAITNKRIDALLTSINLYEFQATSAIPPSIQHAVPYFSTLVTLYNETNGAFCVKMNKDIHDKIMDLLKKGFNISKRLKYNNGLQGDVEKSIYNSLQLRYLMQVCLQNLRYFFRFGQQDPRGIKETLKLFGDLEEDNSNEGNTEGDPIED